MRNILYVILFLNLLHAGVFDFQTIDEAKKAFEQKNYALSSKLFGEVSSEDKRKFYNQGNAYYKAGQFDKAIESYQKAKGINEEARRLYNIGNTYFRKDDMANAIKNYESALKVEPNDKDTKRNLEIAKRKQQQKNRDDKNKKQDKPKDENKNKNENKKEENKNSQGTPKEPNKENLNRTKLDKLLKELEKKKIPTLMYQYNKDDNGKIGEQYEKPW
ncbi:MAG: hypothetical protein KN64_05005 [Sulfurovum sp. AS07-7]|nr:MAG: hypothetical protein KN64_05005 [Sulfurovum sp. AS07-7]